MNCVNAQFNILQNKKDFVSFVSPFEKYYFCAHKL